MTKFSMTAEQVQAANGYDLMMALEMFWRANKMPCRNLTTEERIREALWWAEKAAA